MMRYEESRLYCLSCKEQPDYFQEVVAWQVNRVTPAGTLIDVKDGEVLEYRCPQCYGPADFGDSAERDARASSQESSRR